MMPTHPDVLLAARRGDASARDAVVREALPTVLQWCARLGGPSVDPEDAAHDVLVVVLTRMETLVDLESFPSWLFGVTRRVLAAHRRRAWVRRWVPGWVPDRADSARGPARHAELSDTSRRVQRALAVLPEAQREVLVLCDVEERTDTEVAELLQVPAGTVRSRLRLGRERFRRAAAREGLSAATLELAEGDG